jgi:DNA-binding transcriptional MerR regulator
MGGTSFVYSFLLGLLKPARVDAFTGYRYYTADQLPRLNRVIALKDLGFNLEQIGDLLDENLSTDEMRGMLRLRRAQIEQELQQEQARLAQVEARLTEYDDLVALPRIPSRATITARITMPLTEVAYASNSEPC